MSSVDIHYDCSKKVNNNTSSENNDNSISNSTSDIVNPFAKAMIELANKEYAENQGYNDGIKYTNAMGYAPGTPWCAMFVWWLGLNTSVDGKTLVDDIVPFGSAGTGTYIRLFNNSTKENINFYYNDNCSRLAGKNNSNNKYVPKPGDYIFFDWEANYYDISSDTQDHTALVEKYENGTIYTIEGNSSDTIRKKSYDINDCRVIGFGSWY